MFELKLYPNKIDILLCIVDTDSVSQMYDLYTFLSTYNDVSGLYKIERIGVNHIYIHSTADNLFALLSPIILEINKPLYMLNNSHGRFLFTILKDVYITSLNHVLSKERLVDDLLAFHSVTYVIGDSVVLKCPPRDLYNILLYLYTLGYTFII